MKITNIHAYEIFDSRGLPTVRCAVVLDDGATVESSVPSGTSCSRHEAIELRDGGQRLMGKGVLRAVEIVNTVIAPVFIGKEPNAVQMDLDMIQMDNSENKSLLSANAMLAVSMAIYRAHAHIERCELFELIAMLYGADTVSLPIPMINFINGGIHARNNLAIQEYLVIPYGARNFRHAIEISVQLFYVLKELFLVNDKSVAIGEEGGFAPSFASDEEPFDYLIDALEQANFTGDGLFAFGIDVAASQLYDQQMRLYKFDERDFKTADQMILWYEHLVHHYPLYSIEDGLQEDDWHGWQSLMKKFDQSVQIIGDDLFASNPSRIMYGIETSAANAAVIKPNQIGTVTESLQALKLCQEHGLTTIVSHRSGETEDTFIADLAVGASATHIKAGGLTRGERLAKYNRLLAIENILIKSQD